MKTSIIVAALVFSVAGCSQSAPDEQPASEMPQDQEPAAPTEPTEPAEPAVPTAVAPSVPNDPPTPEDFEEEAARDITASNMEAELSRLEAEIGG